MGAIRPTFKLSILALVLGLALGVKAEEPKDPKDDKGGGFGIGPGMFMVANVKPGGPEIDIFAGTKDSLEVYNGTKDDHTFTVTLAKPESVMSSWELGYESIPDLGWCRLEKNEVEVKAKSEVKVKMWVKVPDKPEYYNRKWMVAVVCSPGKPGRGAVGLQVAARIQIETVASETAPALGTSPIGLSPSVGAIWEAPITGVWQARVKVANNTKEEHTYTLKQLSDVEPKAEKHDRYFGAGFLPVTKTSWMKTEDKDFKLKPGEEKTLTMNVAIAKDAEKGKRYEELVFIQDDKGQSNFVRLRTDIAPEEVKQAEKVEPQK